MKHISLINGQFTDKISVLDRGLSYGDGFFETMNWKYFLTTKVSKVEFWKRHLLRLKKGCESTLINFPSISLIESYRDKILKKSKKQGMSSGVLKIIITRGSGGRGYKFERNMIPNIILLVFPSLQYNEKNYKNGVNLKFCSSNLSINKNIAGFKHLNRLDSVVARSEWTNQNIFEGIITDIDGSVIEGTMTNIFCIKKSKLYTPNISEVGIKGIMRDVILEKFCGYFKQTIEKKITVKFLLESDSVFITNSIIKIVPVKKLEKKKYKIHSAIRDLIKEIKNEKLLEYK